MSVQGQGRQLKSPAASVCLGHTRLDQVCKKVKSLYGQKASATVQGLANKIRTNRRRHFFKNIWFKSSQKSGLF